MTNPAPLRLLAQDADDLAVISAALQDAVAREYLGLPVQVESSRLFRNNGDGTFSDAT